MITLELVSGGVVHIAPRAVVSIQSTADDPPQSVVALVDGSSFTCVDAADSVRVMVNSALSGG